MGLGGFLYGVCVVSDFNVCGCVVIVLNACGCVVIDLSACGGCCECM